MEMNEWLAVVIEEYKSLRTESLTSIQMQQSIIRYGMATIGILFAAGSQSWDKQPLPGIIFLFFLPVISYLVLVIWLGEVARMMRAGLFLIEIESKVNESFSKSRPALTWEAWLRKQGESKSTPQLFWYYYAIILLFMLLAISSVVIGNVAIWSKLSGVQIVLVNFGEFCAFCIACAFVLHTGSKFK